MGLRPERHRLSVLVPVNTKTQGCRESDERSHRPSALPFCLARGSETRAEVGYLVIGCFWNGATL